MTITFKFDQDRIENLVTVDEVINLQKDNIETIRDVLGKFIWNPETETWTEAEAGKKEIGSLTIRELKEVTGSLMKRLRNEAVPLASNET